MTKSVFEALKKIGNGAVQPTRLVKDGPRTYAEEDLPTPPKDCCAYDCADYSRTGIHAPDCCMRDIRGNVRTTETLTCDGCGKTSRWAVIDHECTARLEYCTECWPYD